jgi:hypothetical protein
LQRIGLESHNIIPGNIFRSIFRFPIALPLANMRRITVALPRLPTGDSGGNMIQTRSGEEWLGRTIHAQTQRR